MSRFILTGNAVLDAGLGLVSALGEPKTVLLILPSMIVSSLLMLSLSMVVSAWQRPDVLVAPEASIRSEPESPLP